MDPFSNRAPDLGTSLDRHLEATLSDVSTCIPGTIVKYAASNPPLADVKPTLSQVFTADDGTDLPVEHPVITDCPVAFPQGGGGFLSFPLAAGDPVLLLVAQRSLDAWKETDGKTVTAPGDYRRHHITDAIVLPGVGTARKGIPNAHASDVVLGLMNGDAELHIEPDGTTYLKLAGGKQVQLGAAGASHPLGLGDATDSRLGVIESKLTSLCAALALAGGSFVPVGITPFVADGSNVKSTRAFVDQ